MIVCKSCVGCKFLYGEGHGYSNYTWMNTYVRCALGKNSLLINNQEQPAEWPLKNPTLDAWRPTMDGRCESYAPGIYIVLDPDGKDHPADVSDDAEQIAAICKADGLPEKLPTDSDTKAGESS